MYDDRYRVCWRPLQIRKDTTHWCRDLIYPESGAVCNYRSVEARTVHPKFRQPSKVTTMNSECTSLRYGNWSRLTMTVDGDEASMRAPEEMDFIFLVRTWTMRGAWTSALLFFLVIQFYVLRTSLCYTIRRMYSKLCC